jgi:hypothetical protein
MLAIGLAAAAVEACSLGGFACEEQSDCVDGDIVGTCEPVGGCSFPDGDCESGKRFGEHTRGGLGGQCVPVDAGTGESDAGTASASTATAGETLTSTTEVSTDGSTSVGVSATMTAGDTSEGSGTAGGSDSSTGAEPGLFFDPFDRPNDPVLGNGWIEKSAAAFRILDQQIEYDWAPAIDLRDALFYRPPSESMLDVEASVVVDFTSDFPYGFPQLHLRVQAVDVQTALYLNSYAVVVDTDDPFDPVLTVKRISGYGDGIEAWTPIEPDPIDAETYRLRGRVTGTDPVVVDGFFEVETVDGWEIRATATLFDSGFDRLVVPGPVGASGHHDLQYFVLDDFAYEDLGG